jgi:hypothetical protein
MARGNRLNVIFSDEAIGWLEQEAAKRATSLSDMVRRIVDETRGAYIVPRPEPPPEGRGFTYRAATTKVPET